uniref:DDB1- and CUL4-associated factor 13 n=1 Tax=Phallusia mammillata TaxID=59560 RepID=A0A6F9DB68_9ASCI|nr:DDB1- and CUL4-associated factor 13 [Phallusia mammillata]
MKVKVLSRNPDDYVRETKRDIHRVFRNYDPALHPFEAPREYTRALNAVKLDRVFAKPFIASLDGHRDGVCCMCKSKQKLNSLFSGSCDGELRQWNLTNRHCIRAVQAHTGFVRGLSCSHDGRVVVSVGDDKTIKYWTTDALSEDRDKPINTIVAKSLYTGVDHHWSEATFATCGQTVDIWNDERSEPVRSYRWGTDSVNSVRFNPVEANLCISTISDRSIVLYDIRAAVPLNKVVLKMKSNVVAWNPMEAFVFTAANEDHNLYTFDMRNLNFAMNVHTDHADAVLDVDYAPTGKEFVSGSYDRSIRIFPSNRSRSRDVYHTKRMQRVFCVKWSSDNRYLLSGSDETNVRIWKARASEKLGTLTPREQTAARYNLKLREKFAYHPQIKRISRHRHVPKSIYNTLKEKRTMKEAQRKKTQNLRTHSKPGAVPHVAERAKHIVSNTDANEANE